MAERYASLGKLDLGKLEVVLAVAEDLGLASEKKTSQKHKSYDKSICLARRDHPNFQILGGSQAYVILMNLTSDLLGEDGETRGQLFMQCPRHPMNMNRFSPVPGQEYW